MDEFVKGFREELEKIAQQYPYVVVPKEKMDAAYDEWANRFYKEGPGHLPSRSGNWLRKLHLKPSYEKQLADYNAKEQAFLKKYPEPVRFWGKVTPAQVQQTLAAKHELKNMVRAYDTSIDENERDKLWDAIWNKWNKLPYYAQDAVGQPLG